MTLPTPDATLEAADRNFGNGLLLALDAAIKALPDGGVIDVQGGDDTVDADLAAWCELTGNALLAPRLVRRGQAEADPIPETVPELGSRLWIYTNFNCNLACDYCCAMSSPRMASRRFPVALAEKAVEEFLSIGGRELFLTGGEPFLHPEIAELVGLLSARVPLTILTNAMVFGRGSRRVALDSMDRERVVLQVSLDSAGPELHDSHRGWGSHQRALAGIDLARELGFRVRIAATIDAADSDHEQALLSRLDELEIGASDRVIRRVANEGFADHGVVLTRDDLFPEPTLSVDGAWWHPVAVADPAMRVAAAPLPLAHVLEQIQTHLDLRAASRETTLRTFRCA